MDDPHQHRRTGRATGDREVGRLVPAEESGVEVVRSVERIEVGTERVPWRRVRLVKHVVTERRVVELRREELRVVEEDVAAGDPPGRAGRPVPRHDHPLEIVLSEEEVVVQTRVTPRERVRVWVEERAGQAHTTTPVSREEVRVETRPS